MRTADEEAPAESSVIHTASSVCPLDCADTCSLQVSLERGQINSVRGNDDNPFTRSKLCAKVVHSLPTQVHGSERILTPLRRVKAGVSPEAFEATTWDDALDLVHEHFSTIIAQWGAEAIAPLSYGGPMGVLAGGSMDKRFFHRLGASKVDSSPLCAGTSGAAWEAVFGDAGGIDFEELADSRLILVWGNNVTTCNLHLTKVLRDAQKSGATLVVVDPKRTRIARDADLHIPLLPGTDVALAYAVAALLDDSDSIDRQFISRHVHGADKFLNEARKYPLATAASICGIAPGLITELASLFANKRPAGMSIGVAPERNRNGGAGIRAAFSLLALTGNIGPRGAGPCDVSRFFPIARDALARPDLAPEGLREFNVLDIPRKVLYPDDQTPIKALFIYNHNPVAVHPEQQLMREALLSPDVFVVGNDLCMTDSMACADVILPAVSHLEYGDLYTAYGHRFLQRSKQVLPEQGEGVSNMELFRRLAARFGFAEPCFSDTDDDLARQAFEPQHAELAMLSAQGAVDMTPYAEPAMLRGTLPNTTSGKIELFSDALEASCGEGLPHFKALKAPRDFILVTPASEQRINSTFGEQKAQQRDLLCEINPQDAERQKLIDGDIVQLFNAQGMVDLPLSINPDVRAGTLYVPKGAWIRGASPGDAGNTVNALIPGHKADLAGGACYYDCTVSIRRV
ncbi:MAG: molybdopterin-dependent oxidoreductase [Congregibacter sp.]